MKLKPQLQDWRKSMRDVTWSKYWSQMRKEIMRRWNCNMSQTRPIYSAKVLTLVSCRGRNFLSHMTYIAYSLIHGPYTDIRLYDTHAGHKQRQNLPSNVAYNWVMGLFAKIFSHEWFSNSHSGKIIFTCFKFFYHIVFVTQFISA